jgi:hypothetical protein
VGVGGGGTQTADYMGIAASNIDFNSLRYKCCTGWSCCLGLNST